MQTLDADAGATHAASGAGAGVAIGNCGVALGGVPRMRGGNRGGVDRRFGFVDAARRLDAPHEHALVFAHQPVPRGHGCAVV